MTDNLLDARNLSCPLPILRTKKALLDLAPGERLEILATDPGSVADMAAFCRMTGHVLLESDHGDDGYRFVLRKAG